MPEKIISRKHKKGITVINFAQIKQSVTTRQAAEAYGLSVNSRGMCRCPFHNDHTPSMKVDETFYCFGCGAVGDVITLFPPDYLESAPVPLRGNWKWISESLAAM